MSTYGVTPTGYVAPTPGQILADIEADQRARIDPDFDVSVDSIDGQNNGIFASQLAEVHEAIQASHNDLDPDSVTSDAAADRIAALTGTYRQAASYSTVTLTLTLAAGKTVTAGKQFWPAADPSKVFITTAAATNSGGSQADVTVAAQAASTGPVFAAAGTLVGYTPETGLVASTNVADVVPGRALETTPELMLRRKDELARPGSGTVPAARAEISRLSGVTSVQVYENDTGLIDASGVPPYSVEVIVDGGVDQEIADILWAEKAAGTPYYGTTSVTVTDSQGATQPVLFSRPTLIPAYVVVQVLYYDTAYWSDPAAMQAAIRTALAYETATVGGALYLVPGSDLYAAQTADVAMAVPGVKAAVANVSLTSITAIDYSLAGGRISANARERITVQSSDVAVGIS